MIYYSHVNEDSTPEISVAEEFAPQHIVCVTGSGARVLALLNCPTLRTVVAVDNNPEAQFLAELTIEALKNLDIEQFHTFTGHYETRNSDERITLYRLFKENLSAECSGYWDKNLLKIRSGIVNSGHFEIFLKRIRPLLRIALGRNFYEHLSGSGKPLAGLSVLRWNAVLQLFSYRHVFRLLGNRDNAFVSNGADSGKIRDAFKRLTSENLLADSFISHLVFHGHLRSMKKSMLPITLNDDFLKEVKHKLVTGVVTVNYRTCDICHLAGELAAEAPGRTLFSLSDILSFISKPEMNNILTDILAFKKHPTAVVFRSFLKNSFNEESDRFDRLDLLEKTRMYNVFKTEV